MKKLLIFILINLFHVTYAKDNLSLREIYVITDTVSPGVITNGQNLSSIGLQNQFKQDTASLLELFTGINNASNGAVSSIPYMRGLNDDRIRISVDGIDLSSACTSHTDTDLSLIDINNVDYIKVFAGITPVSSGGDSIAGTIKIRTSKPKFSDSENIIQTASIKSFYKSNNDEQGQHFKSSLASDRFFVSYSGSQSNANNYSSASDFKIDNYGGSSDKTGISQDEVGSTGYQMQNHKLNFGYKIENHIFELKLDYQNIPYQGFVNQRMDVVGQHAHKINLIDTINYSWGQIELQAYHHQIETKMNFGKNKNFNYSGTQGMSMTHHGFTTGFNANSDIFLNDKNTLRLGLETQQYEVDDAWDPTGGMMSPNILKNINDGKRNKYGVYAELDRQWNKEWFSQVGIRFTHIAMDTGDVQGYSGMYSTDANAFNSSQKRKQDNHIDFTLSASYSPSLYQTHEFGYSLKNRSPTLQERYLWSNNAMAASMANWFGDGNGYVGNTSLNKETAHTFAYAAVFHDEKKKNWNFQINPYFSFINDYIDAISFSTRGDGFRTLTMGNQNAKLYGVDLNFFKFLGNNDKLGAFSLDGKISYVRGKNTDSNDDIYHIMPLNMKLALKQNINRWNNSINLTVVDSKNRTNSIRQEMDTSGYALVDLKSSYKFNDNLLFNAGIYNFFDRNYDHPLGGVYFGQGKTMNTTGMGLSYANAANVPGMGRAIFTSMQYNF